MAGTIGWTVFALFGGVVGYVALSLAGLVGCTIVAFPVWAAAAGVRAARRTVTR